MHELGGGGGLGHLAKECKNESKCRTCKKTGHRMDSTACPEFRVLLERRRLKKIRPQAESVPRREIPPPKDDEGWIKVQRKRPEKFANWAPPNEAVLTTTEAEAEKIAALDKLDAKSGPTAGGREMESEHGRRGSPLNPVENELLMSWTGGGGSERP